jgi:membrane-associated phospholipid phosphatase
VGRANFAFAGLCALVLAVATVLVAWGYGLPIRDPDGVIVPMYVQLPVICLLAWLLDVLPRAIARAGRDLGALPHMFVAVSRSRWTRAHVVFAVSGLAAWYICYAAFRNLKGYVPFVHTAIFDKQLDAIDRAVWLGHDPATVLHSLFGTDIAAHFFSFVYVAWIVLIPVTLAIALVWTRNPARGSWYVTAIAADWLLGVAAYFAVPTLGPIYTKPHHFAALTHTYTTTLEDNLLRDRLSVLADPHATHVVQTIAAFPSLHVAMMMTVCLFVTLSAMPRWIQITSWVFLAFTVLATVYLGWHFFTDTVAGAVVGALAVWLAAMGTGNHVGLRPRVVDEEGYVDSDAAGQRNAAASRSA